MARAGSTSATSVGVIDGATDGNAASQKHAHAHAHAPAPHGASARMYVTGTGGSASAAGAADVGGGDIGGTFASAGVSDNAGVGVGIGHGYGGGGGNRRGEELSRTHRLRGGRGRGRDRGEKRAGGEELSGGMTWVGGEGEGEGGLEAAARRLNHVTNGTLGENFDVAERASTVGSTQPVSFFMEGTFDQGSQDVLYGLDPTPLMLVRLGVSSLTSSVPCCTYLISGAD